jgi:hypothetical protein
VPSRCLSVPPAASVAVVVRLGDKAPVIAPNLSSGRAQPRYLGASPSRRWSSLDPASALLDLPPRLWSSSDLPSLASIVV